MERLVAARRAAYYAPPPPPPSESDSDEDIDDAARQDASLDNLKALLAQFDDDNVPAAPKRKKQARPPAGGVPKPRGVRRETWDTGAARARLSAPPPAAAADTSALGATLKAPSTAWSDRRFK